jgi:nitrile hydratase subunit beta
MNGLHDMGGMMGFGPVEPEANEPVFHHSWEARTLALIRAASVHANWTWDYERSVCENRSPSEYLRLSYYEIWLSSFEKLAKETDFLNCTPDPAKTIRAGDVAKSLSQVVNYERKPNGPARFSVGDHVRTINANPPGHTRLPRYLRKSNGQIIAVHGAHVFPDSNACGDGEDPQWLYTVRFTGEEVWGGGARHVIHARLWEPYLQSANTDADYRGNNAGSLRV